jgi:hypothetical protein
MTQTHFAFRGDLLTGAASLALLLCTDANAQAPGMKDPGMGASMIRVLACDGVDAKMEVYLPQSLVNKGDQALRKMRPTIGWYTLDLTSAEKGKVMEPVRVSMSSDGKTVTVNQYTRRLPPTAIPVAGGTVDFDQRFGTKAKCGPFNQRNGNA